MDRKRKMIMGIMGVVGFAAMVAQFAATGILLSQGCAGVSTTVGAGATYSPGPYGPTIGGTVCVTVTGSDRVACGVPVEAPAIIGPDVMEVDTPIDTPIRESVDWGTFGLAIAAILAPVFAWMETRLFPWAIKTFIPKVRDALYQPIIEATRIEIAKHKAECEADRKRGG